MLHLIDDYECIDYRKPYAGELYFSNGVVHVASGHMILEFPILKRVGGGWYWYVTDSGNVHNTPDLGFDMDSHRLSSGNYYKTEAEAEAVASKVRVCYESI